MFKIDADTKIIHCTRGDKGIIELKVPLNDTEFYKFQQDDIITLGVYTAKKMNEEPLIYKEITVENEADSVDIGLTSEDTKIGELINKKVDYWYEIELNHEQTLIGYDEDEAKIFRLYPEGSKW